MAVTYNRNTVQDNASLVAAINDELTKIQTAFEDALSRSGTAPNAMGAVLDMGSRSIINIDVISANDIIIDGLPIPSLDDLQELWDAIRNIFPIPGTSDQGKAPIVNSTNDGYVLSPAPVVITTDLADVAFSGEYGDLLNTPDLGDIPGTSDDITQGSTNLFMTPAERTKLSGIEDGADVTDTANVQAAGAFMAVNAGALATEDQITSSSQIDNDVVEETNLSAEVRTKLNNSAPNNFNATVDPTVNDDSSAGWGVGSVWINTATPESFRCLDSTVGAAVWIQTTLTTDELATVASTGNYNDLNGLPTLGTAAAADTGDFATAAQGAKADTALQPNDNISELTNDAGYVDAAGASSAAPVQDVFGRSGSVVAAYGDYEIADIAPTTDVLVNASQNLDNTWHNVWVRVTAAADITVPASGVWNIPGAIIHFIKMTPGTVQFIEDTGVTINSVGGLEILRENGVVTLKNLAADTWILVGDV